VRTRHTGWFGSDPTGRHRLGDESGVGPSRAPGAGCRRLPAGAADFVARFKLGVWGGNPQGALPAWGESLYTVEAAGWVLDKWAVATDNGGASNAFPVFRRREPWTPQDRGVR